MFDTYSVVFRAFHALPRMNTQSGFPTSALYGFCSLVIKVLREQRPRALAFAVDAPARTFRAERYAVVEGKTPEILELPKGRNPLYALLSSLPGVQSGIKLDISKVPGLAEKLRGVDAMLELRKEPVWLIVPYRLEVR